MSNKSELIDNVEDDAAIILKVASLIEQGSDGMMQLTGHYFDATNPNSCCAMGALIKALGGDYKSACTPTFNLLTLLGIGSWPRIQYPKCDLVPFAADERLNQAALPDVVIFLNDRLGWSFSKIVDYLRDCTLPQAAIIKVKE